MGSASGLHPTAGSGTKIFFAVLSCPVLTEESRFRFADRGIVTKLTKPASVVLRSWGDITTGKRPSSLRLAESARRPRSPTGKLRTGFGFRAVSLKHGTRCKQSNTVAAPDPTFFHLSACNWCSVLWFRLTRAVGSQVVPTRCVPRRAAAGICRPTLSVWRVSV